MYLKAIHIYGFKSFAQEVTIELAPGITAIVGPNGGGKSNVVDAIRWALGEQRLRDLRAQRWEDLLYQGGNGRSRAQMAEVQLDFDNQDGEMKGWPEALSVIRRYYRSGDSEYLINGQSVRLKDITDLFLDSGLGRFNYAIISQGQVETALLMRASDRLEQLEEAAGVSRYKVRKKETIAHLNETEGKLVRLNDLLDEVGRHQDEVRERADKESRYRTWEALRKDWQTRLEFSEYHRAMEKKAKLLEQIGALGHERKALSQELYQLIASIGTTRMRLQEKEKASQEDVERLRRQQEATTELKMQEAKWRERLLQVQRELQQSRAAIQWVEQQLAELHDDVSEPGESWPALEEFEALEQQRLAWQDEMSQRQNKRVADQEELQNLKEKLSQAEQRLAHFKGILGMDAQVGEIAAVLRHRQKEAQNLEHAVRSLTEELDRMTGEKGRLRQFVGRLENELFGLRHQLSGRQARLRALHQLEAEGEGLQLGVRSVLQGQQEGKLEGVVGTLGGLLQSPPDLILAIDIALGAARQDLVMETEAHAKQAVHYLKSLSLGRATFLPLDTIRPAKVPPDDYRRLSREMGVIGWGADLVQVPAKVGPAVQHILGRVLIVQGLDDAARLGRLHRYRYKMVTIDGQVVHAGGAITGGSRHQQRHSMKSRQVEIQELTVRVREDSEVVQAKEELLLSTRGEMEDVEHQIDAVRETLAEKRQAWQQARAIVDFDENFDPQRLVGEVDRLQDEIRAAQEASDESRQESQELDQKYRELVQRSDAMREERHRWQARMSEARAVKERLAGERARLSQQQENHRKRIHELQSLEQEAKDRLGSVSGELQTQKERTESGERERRQRIEELSADREQLARLEMRQRALELDDRKMEQKLNAWTQEVAEIGVRYEHYQVPPDLDPLSRADEEHARREVQRITQSLAELGPVVPGSLALFEQLEERQAYLLRESEDVQEAQKELHETLREIDVEMERRVKETAAQVEEAFSEACRQLYGGGDGGFQWVSGENGGVDLWVRPIGKRPSHLSLLSGGEKALGGVAWLFSLLSVRPSPFVVLDEVEASLDEANAERFAQYIRSAPKRTQYVMVTHHRQTMEAADALWGVAGDGRGQSRLVSVLLAEANELTS